MFSSALDLILQRVSSVFVFDVFVCIGFDSSTCVFCFCLLMFSFALDLIVQRVSSALLF